LLVEIAQTKARIRRALLPKLRLDLMADITHKIRFSPAPEMQTDGNSVVTGKRLSLSRRIPCVLSPEGLQGGVAAAKNVAFSFSDVGHRFGKHDPRSQIAFTIATVLPHMPSVPEVFQGAVFRGSAW